MNQFKDDVKKVMEFFCAGLSSCKAKEREVFETLKAEAMEKQRARIDRERTEIQETATNELTRAYQRFQTRSKLSDGGQIKADGKDLPMLQYDLTQEEFDIIANRNKNDRAMVIALRNYAKNHPRIEYIPPLFGAEADKAADNLFRNAMSYIAVCGAAGVSNAFDIELATRTKQMSYFF